MNIFWIELYNGKYRDFLNTILSVKNPTKVFTPNPEILHRAYFDAEFMQILQSAEYNVPDANGLYVGQMMQEGRGFWASCFRVFFDKKSVYKEYWELIKWSDLTKDILENGKKNPQKILIIDRKNAVLKNDFERKKDAVQKNMKAILEAKFPWNEIFVIFEGEKSDFEIADLISKNGIDFVFSTIGMKIQEERLQKVFLLLPVTLPVVGLGVGASIDFLLGLQKRSPKIFQNLGLEWLYRLMMQPKIRYKRIKTALIDFPKLIAKNMQK